MHLYFRVIAQMKKKIDNISYFGKYTVFFKIAYYGKIGS